MSTSGQVDVGDWIVEVRTRRTGICVGKSGTAIEVEFRSSLGQSGREQVQRSVQEVAPLNPLGLVVWLKQGCGWKSRVVTGVAGDLIAFGDKSDQIVRREDVFLLDRTTTPDVLDFVRNRMTGLPGEMKVRQNFREWYGRQIRMCQGYRSLVATAVRPTLHQLNVVQRVLDDPVRRFVLADEVGLGKSIEAGLIARQMMFENPKLRTLIVAPKALVGQWEDELKFKIRLGGMLGNRLNVVSYEGIDEKVIANVGLLIVDEIHRICDDIEPDFHWYPNLQKNAEKVESLLLLTATPYRSDALTLLRILHLIDPAVNQLDDIEGFSQRLRQRAESADLITVFDQDDLLPETALTVLEILNRSINDEELRALGAELAAAINENRPFDQLLRRIRLLLVEKHRIGRRIIRMRRDAIKDFYVRGREVRESELVDEGRTVVDGILDRWREGAMYATDESVHKVFEDLLDGCLNGPSRMNQQVQKRIRDIDNGSNPLFDGERNFLQGAVRQISPFCTQRRDFVLRFLDSEIAFERGPKLAIAVSDTTEATELYESLKNRFGENRIVASLKGMSQEAAKASKEFFATRSDCRVIVVDRDSEEGCNLQSAARLINFDLPFSINRIEQRIGRADRYSDRDRGRVKVEIFAENSSWVRGWHHFLSHGVGIFEESVATLQLPLVGAMSDLAKNLLCAGSSAFGENLENLKAMLSQERRRVANLERTEATLASRGSGDGFGNLMNPSPEYLDWLDFDELSDDSQNVIDGMTDINVGYGITRQNLEPKIFNYRLVRWLRDNPLIEPEWSSVLPRNATSQRLKLVRRDDIELLRISNRFIDRLYEVQRNDQRGRFEVRHKVLPINSDPQVVVEYEVSETYQIPSDVTRRVDHSRLTRLIDGLLRPQLMRIRLDGNGVLSVPHDRGGFEDFSRLEGGDIDDVMRDCDLQQILDDYEFLLWEEIEKRFLEHRREVTMFLENRFALRSEIYRYRKNPEAVEREQIEFEFLLSVLQTPQRRVESVKLFATSGIVGS